MDALSCQWRRLPKRSRFTGIARKLLPSATTSAVTHTATSVDRKTEAAATESEIPVPIATYAAKQAGHFGSNARISVGIESFASANPRCLPDDGWFSPSAALVEILRPVLAGTVQHVALFIGDSHFRSRTQLLSAQLKLSLRDSGHDGGPTTS